jgi:predicted dehydrogenase
MAIDPRAARLLAAVPDPRRAPPLRWGILAPGGIANKFADAVSRFTAGRVVAVASRDEGRARAFAQAHGIPRAYAGYGHLLEDPDVDAVYVASPHSAHRDLAVAAARAGKHVLVEKALARNVTEVDEIFAAAHTAGVFAMEAMWTRHLPHIGVAREWIAQGRIGQIVTVVADHGQSLDLGPEHRLKNPALAGGALLDLGVYPVSFVVDLLGAPTSVQASGHLTETGVDATVAMILGYPDPVVAQASCTLKTKTPTTAVICGTTGRIELDGDFYAPTTLRLLSGAKIPDVLEQVDGRLPNGFQFEIAEVARCVADGRQESDRMSWDSSRAVIGVLDSARSQLGVRYPGE